MIPYLEFNVCLNNVQIRCYSPFYTHVAVYSLIACADAILIREASRMIFEKCKNFIYCVLVRYKNNLV